METTRTTSLLAALALSVGAAACQPPAPEGEGGEAAMDTAQETAVDTAAIMAELDSMRTAFEEAVAADDFEAQAAAYTRDAVYSAPGAPPVRGRDSIRAALERESPPGGATLEIEPIDIRLLGPDWLYELGTGTLTFTPESAAEPVSMSSTYLAVFRRTDEGWRLHVESLSPDAPPPETP